MYNKKVDHKASNKSQRRAQRKATPRKPVLSLDGGDAFDADADGADAPGMREEAEEAAEEAVRRPSSDKNGGGVAGGRWRGCA